MLYKRRIIQLVSSAGSEIQVIIPVLQILQHALSVGEHLSLLSDHEPLVYLQLFGQLKRDGGRQRLAQKEAI